MTVREAEAFCGSHNYGWLPISWLADDGFGNPMKGNVLGYLYFMQGA